MIVGSWLDLRSCILERVVCSFELMNKFVLVGNFELIGSFELVGKIDKFGLVRSFELVCIRVQRGMVGKFELVGSFVRWSIQNLGFGMVVIKHQNRRIIELFLGLCLSRCIGQLLRGQQR